jgi:uncharacterized protein
VQVTIDGDRETHDKQRKLKNADRYFSRTYDKVLSNVIMCKNILDIKIRINIDKKTHPSISELTSVLDDNRISYYVAPVKRKICDHKGDTSENRQLCISMNPEAALGTDVLFARAAGCAATDLFSVTICPDGSLLKCWEEVGKNIAYGNILKDSIPDLIKSRIWLEWNPYSINSTCRSCKMLPTCGGGCPNDSLEVNNKQCIYTPGTYEEYIRVNFRLKRKNRTDSRKER